MRRTFSYRSVSTALSTALAIAIALGSSGCDKLKMKGGQTPPLSPASPEALAAVVATPGGKVHPVSEANFDAHVQDPNRLVVVDFYADWCGPCRQLSPILQSLATEFPSNVLFLKVNVDENKAVAKKHGVRGIPDVRFFLKGQQVDSMVGLGSPQAIRKIISTHAPTEKAVAEMMGAQTTAPAMPPRSGIFGLLDKTRSGMEKRAEQATLPTDDPAATKVNDATPANPQVPPAIPPIRPVNPNEDALPPGMSKSTPL